MREMVVGMTGGRPKRLPWGTNESDPRCVKLKKKLYDLMVDLISQGATTFVCGMALGCDTYFAETVLDFKDGYGLELIAALSCADQAHLWADKDKKRFRDIILRCTDTHFTSIAHTPGCEKERNHYIVDTSDVLIAIYSGAKRSGTAQTIAYAQKKGVPIIFIDPTSL